MNNPSSSSDHPIWEIPAARGGAGGPDRPAAFVQPSSARSVALAIGVIIAVVAPWLIHLLPAGGPPLGPVLLPMFYAPLIASLALRLPLAVAISALAPAVSYQLTGLPDLSRLPSLVLQITIFVVAVRALRRHHWFYTVTAAYFVSLIATAAISSFSESLPTVSVLGTLQVAWPGVLVLAALGFIGQKSLR